MQSSAMILDLEYSADLFALIDIWGPGQKWDKRANMTFRQRKGLSSRVEAPGFHNQPM